MNKAAGEDRLLKKKKKKPGFREPLRIKGKCGLMGLRSSVSSEYRAFVQISLGYPNLEPCVV